MNVIVYTESQLRELLKEIFKIEVVPYLEKLHQAPAASAPPPEILNLQQAAELVDLAPSTVYGLVNKSLLPHFKKGGKLRFKRSQLIEWIESGEKKTQSQIQQGAKIYTRKASKH